MEEILKTEGSQSDSVKITDEKMAANYEIAKSQMQYASLKKMRQQAVTQKAASLKDEDMIDVLDEKVNVFKSVEQINALTNDEVDEVYRDADGNKIELHVPFDTKKESYTFLRDYLCLIWTANTSLAEIDKAMEEYEKDMEESKEEIAQALQDFVEQGVYFREGLINGITNAEDETVRASLTEQLGCFDVIPYLEKVKENYLSLKNPANSYGDFKNASRRDAVYAKYLEVSAKLGLRTNLVRYAKFEEKYLPEYAQYNGLFIFLVMKHIAHCYTPYKLREGLFIAQFAIMLQNLFGDKIEQENKDKICAIAQKIIDVVI